MFRPKTTLALVTLAAAAALGGAVAAQPQLPEPGAVRPAAAAAPTAAAPTARPWSDVARQLEAQGYVVRELDRERSGFEAEVTAPDGRRLELHLDGQGRVLRESRDD